jgi:vacuolar-type H+-ATPase subunit H
MLDALQKIKEIELSACKRIEAAQEEGKAMLSKAEEEAKVLIREAIAEANHKATEMMEMTCIEAKTIAERINFEGTKQAAQIKQQSDVHLATAVNVIISQTTGES